MLDILQQFIDTPSVGCKVQLWVETQGTEVENAFYALMDKQGLNLTDLYNSLSKANPLPFKLTSFRTHMRGTCTCPKK